MRKIHMQNQFVTQIIVENSSLAFFWCAIHSYWPVCLVSKIGAYLKNKIFIYFLYLVFSAFLHERLERKIKTCMLLTWKRRTRTWKGCLRKFAMMIMNGISALTWKLLHCLLKNFHHARPRRQRDFLGKSLNANQGNGLSGTCRIPTNAMEEMYNFLNDSIARICGLPKSCGTHLRKRSTLYFRLVSFSLRSWVHQKVSLFVGRRKWL